MNEQDETRNYRRPTAEAERPSGYRFYDEEHHTGAPLSPPPADARQNMSDQPPPPGPDSARHLDQLSIGYKIYAGINALLACFPLIYLVLGIMMLAGSFQNGIDPPAPFVGLMFVAMGLIFSLLGWGISIANFYAGKFIKERTHYTFCFVVSCINCTFMPLGTVLGVFSLVVLVRDQVKRTFDPLPTPDREL